ncbi:MAG: manganese efflux pump MntP family protein [Planctomycetota bacterium]
MGWISLLAIAVALAMDAFAVSIAAGMTVKPLTGRGVFRLAFHFGLFQALMPVIGWSAGKAVYGYIAAADHWVAFALLLFVGGKMSLGALKGGEGERFADDPTSGWSLVLLSVATSIDALAVGLSLAMTGSEIVLPATVIGLVAAAFTAVGMALGCRIGSLWGRRVEVAGGLVLVAVGANILFDHLSV